MLNLSKPSEPCSFQRLAAAVANDDVLTLIWLLESGAASKISASILQQLRDRVKETIRDLQQSGGKPGDSAFDAASEKDKLIKIYINAGFTINTMKALKNWLGFEIIIDGVISIPAAYVKEFADIPAFVYIETEAVLDKTNPEPTPWPPKMPIASRVTVQMPKAYSMKHKPQVTEADRGLNVKVKVGAEKGPRRLIGSALIPMPHIHSRCHRDSAQWHHEDFELRSVPEDHS